MTGNTQQYLIAECQPQNGTHYKKKLCNLQRVLQKITWNHLIKLYTIAQARKHISVFVSHLLGLNNNVNHKFDLYTINQSSLSVFLKEEIDFFLLFSIVLNSFK